MGCTSSLVADDVEYAQARDRLQHLSKGDFEAAFSLGAVLGRGGFAQVQAACRRDDHENLAVKIVSLSASKPSNSRKEKGEEEEEEEASEGGRRPTKMATSTCMTMKDVVCELTGWSAVQGSKHVVNLVSAMVEEHRVFMVMERCEGSLLRKCQGEKGFWALESRRVLKEMLLGVQACHHAGVVHRDIKPQNYLLGSDGITVKLCDFGLAVRMPRRGQLRGVAGTIPFTSPEMLMDSGYGKATDMWSYGVTAYLLCFGVFPFPKAFCQNSECMEKAILLGLPARCLQNGSGAASFIGPQLERCKSARCTVEQALAHWHLQEASAESPKLRCSAGSSDASTADLGTRSSGIESASSGSITPRPLDDGSLCI